MTQYEMGNTGQRVLERIMDKPLVAYEVLEELVFEPRLDPDMTKKIAEQKGTMAAELYSFLGSVISNYDVYQGIDIPPEAQELAQETMLAMPTQNPLKRGEIDPNLKAKISMQNRANELRAVASLAIKQRQPNPIQGVA